MPVGALDAVGEPTAENSAQTHVGGLMRGLHRCDDIELGEAGRKRFVGGDKPGAVLDNGVAAESRLPLAFGDGASKTSRVDAGWRGRRWAVKILTGTRLCHAQWPIALKFFSGSMNQDAGWPFGIVGIGARAWRRLRETEGAVPWNEF